MRTTRHFSASGQTADLVPDSHPPVLHIVNVRKNYQALRPLRVRTLTIGAAERIAVSGFDAGAAEVLVNLVTGASVPDEGEVEVLGRTTASIADGDEWLASLDRFGIVSPRAVLLDSATLLQNLAMSYTLDIEPVPDDVASRATVLAHEVGLAVEVLPRPIAQLTPEVRMRAHLARAVALNPRLLILEHPTAGLPESDRRKFGKDVARIADARSLATLIISEDAAFSREAAHRMLALNGATGELRRKRGFFGF
jgi:ABC-type transporter Mla maintaining outer membrane lipid asymmetry ATPase subunit MlaF